MKKRLLSALLALCMVLTLLPTAWAADATSGSCGDYATWSFDSNTGTLTISGSGAIYDYDDYDYTEMAPWMTGGGQEGYSKDIRRIVISEGITHIGNCAFGNTYEGGALVNLEEIVIPSTVTSIGYRAFQSASIESIFIPASVQQFGEDEEAYDGLIFGGIALINVDPVNPYFKSIDGVLYRKTPVTALVAYPHGKISDTLYVPQDTEVLDMTTMNMGYNVESVHIAPSVKKISSVLTGGGVKNLYFYGDAPTEFTFESQYGGYIRDEQLTIYYPASAQGWDAIIAAYNEDKDLIEGNNPFGISPLCVFETWTPGEYPSTERINELDGETTAKIISLSPANGAIDVGYDASNPPTFRITFDREIASGSQEYLADVNFDSNGAIKIYRASDNVLIYPNADTNHWYSEYNFTLDNQKSSLSITPVNRHTLLDPGTEYYITMGEGFITFADGSTNQAINKGEWGFCTIEKVAEGTPPLSTTFTVKFDKGSAQIGWNEEWFQYPATTYIHELAVASAALSAVTYSDDQSSDQIDYVLKEELNFDDIYSRKYDWTNDWSASSSGSAGYTFAHKTIAFNDESITLVVIVVRGSMNTADWLSNVLDSGWFDGDSGFENAAEGIVQALETYCLDKHIDYSDNIKFLVTGHSRGGLIANIVAAELTTKSILDSNHLDRAIGSRNVFGYTFASPRPAAGAVRLSCSNIWNVINYPDVVPKVPPTNSIRYGTDLYLPNKKYSANYSQFAEPMRTEYKRLTGDNYVEDFIWFIGNPIPTNLLPRIGAVHSIAAYYSWLSSYTAGELFNTTKNPTYKELMIACPVDVFVYNAAGILVASIVNDEVVVDDLEAEVVVDDSTPGVQEKVKIVYLPIDQTYSVEIKATGEGTVSYTVREMEVTDTYDPSEIKIHVQSGTDKVLRTVSFNNIEIAKNDVLTGKIDGLFSIPAADYALTKNGKEVIYPDSDSLDQTPSTPSYPSISSNPSYQITVPSTTNGTVTVTPTSAKSGTKVTITATPDNGYKVGSITVTNSSGNGISVTDNGDGTYIFTMPASQVTVSVTFTAIETPWVNPFTDVSESDWFYDGVAYVAQNGLMQGVGNGKFNPSGITTRGMIVTILYRLENEPTVSQPTFTDVAAGQYYTEAVAWAAVNKIVEGYGNNTFGPNDDITREQMATILYRYATYKNYDMSGQADLSSYADTGSISSWALTAMRWANNEGLIGGRTATTLVPKGTATRTEVAVILSRFCQSVAGLE